MAISISSSPSPYTSAVTTSSASAAPAAPQGPGGQRHAIFAALKQAAAGGNQQAAQLLSQLKAVHQQLHAYRQQGQQPPAELRQANHQLLAAASQLTGVALPQPPQAQPTAVAAYNGVSSFGG